MKCVMCNKGEFKKKMTEYKEFGVSLGKYKANVCMKCGEAFFDSETAGKIQDKSKALGLFGLAKKTKVAKVGNSLAIRIPKEIADFVKLKKEEEVRIVPKSQNELVIGIN
ncbi:AbrB/MazE/SpoVT family DNA-binding domain-containing protein [Candidatus Woesearchaeota archaeon]|nr:AbrB/MazE/SpoVT family DNA-binding domain-containing protein [Candidatus Woesearchaeota archaeon]MBI2661802.1 AbrB/MazE/SpoVT family DNA-binding domain-containing protein [Candidatus Woesearchaeota archaeon]